jgi:hypothetical protein
MIAEKGGHLTVEKGATWRICPPFCSSNGVAQAVPEPSLRRPEQKWRPGHAAGPTSAAARDRVPDSRCGLHAPRPRRVKAVQEEQGVAGARSSWP